VATELVGVKEGLQSSESYEMNAMALKSDGSDEVRAKAAHANGKMKRKVYEKELHELQVELCRSQDWVKETGERIIILFEGRDAAGKGGTIKAITERVSPQASMPTMHGASTSKKAITWQRARSVIASFEREDLKRV
jgi:polyphosphate kinase 2 (PPK2 family)